MLPIADPYLDPSSKVLKNLVGATSQRELEVIEADLVTGRTIQFVDRNLFRGNCDFSEVLTIHAHLFQDLYPWAGTVRTLDMQRGNGEPFAPVSHIERLGHNFSAQLSESNHLKQLDKPDFVTKLADFYNQLNYIHPFREGNGRTQRLFWSHVAMEAGWILDWLPLRGARLNQISKVAREDMDTGPLIQAMTECVRPA